MTGSNLSWSIPLLLASSPAIAACNLCDRAGCDAIDSPADSVSIETGFAGAAASESDLEENGCQECGLADGELYFWASPTPIEDAADAQALVGDSYETILIHETYEWATSPGDYLVCGDRDDSMVQCAAITLADSEVVTVNLRYLNAPSQVLVFYPGQDSPDTERIYELDVPM